MKIANKSLNRRRPIGAEVQPGGGVSFRIWAPVRRRVAVVFEKKAENVEPVRTELTAEENGYFAGIVAGAEPGDRYRLALDDDEQLYPDPASRFQPAGPHGPSQIVDPHAFAWTDQSWSGIPNKQHVIYEMHIGTFTSEGTWQSATEQLPQLAELGVTILQVMPVADFPGRFGWGYDGVNLFAPTRLYGVPDDFRRFVDRAHAVGLAVILDVVYNHLGPDGNFLPQFAEEYFSKRHKTDWGAALNFDGDNSAAVREFILANVEHWIDEYHLDGLRLDATQNIYDDSQPHVLAEINARARAAAGDRSIFIVGENEPQDVTLIRSNDDEGYGIDALWNDDFHHTAMVLLSGRTEAYYTDYRGTPQEFVSAVKYGFLYQGQWYAWQKQRRGTAVLDQPPDKFVTFIQNHDQVANSSRGIRCHGFAAAGSYRALTAFWLLAPQIPMLFQGQEFASSAPFFYFADHRDDLARLVHEGRCEFMRQFRSVARPEVQAKLPDPADPATFLRCKLDFAERNTHGEIYSLHKDLIKLRQTDPVLSKLRAGHVDGAILGPEAFVIRFFANPPTRTGRKRKPAALTPSKCEKGDRIMFVNFGADLHLNPAPEPLLAPPAGCLWENYWSSEDFPYGGTGTAPLETENNWQIPGHAAVVLRPRLIDVPTEGDTACKTW